MRIRIEKVKELSKQIFDVIKEDEDCQFVRDEDMVMETIRETFIEDLKREDRIEAEIWQKLDANKDQIMNRQVDRQELYRKAKQTIAKSRGLVF